MIKLILADDHPVFISGLRAVFDAEDDMTVLSVATTGREAVQAASDHQPDVAVLDLNMPDGDGLWVCGQLRAAGLATRALILTMYDDEDYLVECMEVGAAGYVLKDSPAALLVSAIRDVNRGGSYLSPRMLSQLVDDFRSRIKSANRLPRFATLTTREREVLKMLAEGNSVKEIACDLNLSVKTVEAHKFNLMRKLDIHNKAQLVQYAIQKKIIKIPNLV